ncbi:MAG TPA: hypothetical protein VFH49_12985, partial [Aquabacterium sp.]|nr:hypothetical protein [Aquabacterium sp.]
VSFDPGCESAETMACPAACSFTPRPALYRKNTRSRRMKSMAPTFRDEAKKTGPKARSDHSRLRP